MVFSREMKTGKNKVKHCIWNIVSNRIHIIIPNVTPFLCERIVKFIKISRLVELTRILWISWKQVKLWLKKKERKNAENLFAHGSKYSRSFASGSIRSDFESFRQVSSNGKEIRRFGYTQNHGSHWQNCHRHSGISNDLAKV